MYAASSNCKIASSARSTEASVTTVGVFGWVRPDHRVTGSVQLKLIANPPLLILRPKTDAHAGISPSAGGGLLLAHGRGRSRPHRYPDVLSSQMHCDGRHRQPFTNTRQ